jgi:hypothetical protein
MRVRQRGAIVIILVAIIALAFLGFCLYALSHAMNSITRPVEPRVPAASTGDAPFIQTWSMRLSPPLVHEMALAPSRSKWTGAIDHTVTTDYFLHALDTVGREVWKQRFDPKDVATLEPVPARVLGHPVVLLSASRRIFCFDLRGTRMWETPLWHHPGTLAATEFDGGAILAAGVHQKAVVRIGPDGRVLDAWSKSDPLRRFRAIQTHDGLYGISSRWVSGPAPGVGHVLAFF